MERLLEKHGFSANDLIPFDDVKLLLGLGDLEINEEKKACIIEQAEAELKRPLLAIPASSFVGYYNGTHPEYIPEFYERRHGAMVLAMAESFEGKGRFVNRLIDLVWLILEETVWIHPAHLADKGAKGNTILPPIYKDGLTHNVDLRTGDTVGCLAVIYKYSRELFDSITPVLNERIIYEVRKKALYPYIQCHFWWAGEGGTKVINWGPWITSNMLLAAAWLESDETLRRAIVSKAIMTLNSYTLNYCNDGGCDEGAGYWSASCGGFLNCLDLLYDLSGGKINIYSEPHIKRMFEFVPKYNIHDRFFMSFSDAGCIYTYDSTMLRRMGEVTDSEMLKSFAGHMARYDRKFDINHHMPYSSLRSLYSKKVEPCAFKAPKNVWFPDLKVGYSREFDRTDKGMMICMVGGSNGVSHNHNDLGSIILYHDGNPVLIDTGVGHYDKLVFGPKRYTLTTHSSGYHNTVNIAGQLQCVGSRHRTCNESYDEATGFVTMEVTRAFPEEAGINSYVRSAGLEGSVAKIIDTFDLKCESEIDIHFVTHRKPEILPDGSIALTEGRIMTYDASLTPEIEAYPPHDDRVRDNWGTDELYNIHLKGKITKGSLVTYIR